MRMTAALLVLQAGFALFLVAPAAAESQHGGLPALQKQVAALQAQVATLQAQLAGLQTLATLPAQVASLQDVVSCMSKEGDDVIFEGCNVHVRSGSGSTTGAVNGLGNLIVGYNEADVPKARTGSHNVVVGPNHSYTSFGGFVAGASNEISGRAASVCGGIGNSATGLGSSVSGGQQNIASGTASAVSGGAHNTASNFFSSVSGGAHNSAPELESTVSGGLNRTAPSLGSWVAGSLFEPN